MDKLLSAIADKLDEPCWLIALAVVGLAVYAIGAARKGADAEGDRALLVVEMALGQDNAPLKKQKQEDCDA